MTDIVDAQTRSRMMSNIRGKNTGPELILRKALHAKGLRFRLHGRQMSGKPDIVFPKYKAVCFVHGCFWHRHPGCRYATTPTTRPEFWAEKFGKNVARDERNIMYLTHARWRVSVVWECTLKGGNAENVATDVADWLMHGDGLYSPNTHSQELV